MTRRALLLLCLFAAGLAPRAGAEGDPVPLVAAFAFGDSGGAVLPVDSGPLHLASDPKNLTPVASPHGPAARFDGPASYLQVADPRLDDLVAGFTVTCWVQVERFPGKGGSYLISKGGNSGWQLGLGDARQLYFHGSWGGGWYQTPWKGQIPQGAWTHVALTFQKGGQARVYLQGTLVTTDETPFAAWKMHDPLRVGGADWAGAIADLRLYAVALTPAQVAAEAQGQTLPTRASTPADFPAQGYPVRLSLGRFDMPLAAAAYDARRLQTATRFPAPDATDWPALKLNGAPLFREGPTQNVEVPLLKDSEARSLFRTPRDNVIDPIDHWFRANEFRWGRTYVYTTDRTARTASGDYELWVFPIEIRPDGDRPIEQVQLTLGGETIYQREEKLHTLTLLLPANLTGAPYCLSVNGSDPVEFSVGLQPVQPGHPEDRPLEVRLQIPGFTVANAERPPVFPHQKAWDADLQALGKETPPPTPPPALTGFGRYLGLAVPRSPIGIFTTSMRAGMSGGHYFQEGHVRGFAGTPEAYAAHLAENGYDFAFDDAEPKTLDGGARFEEWLAAMARHGLKAGANPAIPGNLDILGNPNLAFQSTYLPEWGAPAYRDAQLLTQRFGRFPSFLGLLIGADNAGYVPYWDWAPTIPDRPWGRAWLQFQEGHSAKAPVGPALSPSKSYETRGTQREFLDYVKRYDDTFQRYAYFTQAVREVKPDAILTTGSYGSSPGVGGRGGWPWATIPALMNASLPVQTAYDWNELGSSKPLHNVALIDRLRSANPSETWALIDDFGLFFGREARQRAYALALTRGVRAVGTNFLAHETADQKWHADAVTSEPRPRGPILAEQKELYDWIHRYGGIWQGTRPLAPVGVLYVHPQAISRAIVGGENPDAKALLNGSHEGKTTEALFLCHMAGWPARIVTPAELDRHLWPEMKTLLLTGLNRFDTTWVWYEGLESQLKAFVAAGGKLILDDESVVPEGLPATHAALHIAAYVTQSKTDASPLLLARNQENATALKSALQGSAPPLAVSPDETIWAVPHETGEVQYVTAVNWASQPGQNASQVVKGQTGTLAWHTNRPIYDLRAGREITSEAAARVDFTKDAVQLFALPPAKIAAPSIQVARPDGIQFYEASVNPGCRGVPVQVVVKHGAETATLYGTSGVPVPLPIGPMDSGPYQIEATELLTHLSASISLSATPLTKPPHTQMELALRRFTVRRATPLTIALTPTQISDPQVKKAVDVLTAYYTKAGRHVQTGRIEPNGVVLGLQPLRSIEKFPQWRTIPSDLILFGSPRDNLLLLDQARGGLLAESPVEGAAVLTYSPFVGEFQVLNILATDPSGFDRALSQIPLHEDSRYLDWHLIVE